MGPANCWDWGWRPCQGEPGFFMLQNVLASCGHTLQTLIRGAGMCLSADLSPCPDSFPFLSPLAIAGGILLKPCSLSYPLLGPLLYHGEQSTPWGAGIMPLHLLDFWTRNSDGCPLPIPSINESELSFLLLILPFLVR